MSEKHIDKSVSFIGVGNMAEALLRGILNAHLIDAANIWVSHPREQRREELADAYGVHVCADNSEAAC